MKKLQLAFFHFLFLLIIYDSNFVFAQKNKFEFQRLTTENGLSHSIIWHFYQDSKGFIWIGSDDGLMIFDGYSFKVFKHDATDTNSISNNTVFAIVEDGGGRIWIGTHNGLNRLDRTTYTFKKYFFNPKNPASLSNNHISNLCLDNYGQLWIGTDNGLNRYNPKKDNFSRYNVKKDIAGQPKGNSTTALICDKKGFIWTSDFFFGINKIDTKTGVIKNYPVDPVKGPIKSIITALCANPNGNIWLGSFNGDIIDFDPIKEYSYYYSDYSGNLKDNIPVRGIIQSKNKLWLIKSKSLINIDLNNKKIEYIQNNSQDPGSFPKGSIYSIAQTKDENIWVGIEGIVYFNPIAEKFSSHYYSLPKESSEIKQNYAKSFESDKAGNLFIGTYEDGLIKISRRNSNIKRITTPIVFKNSIISDIHKRKDGNFWIATNKGLVLYNPQTNSVLRHYTNRLNDPKSLFHNVTEIVFEDSRGLVWVSTQESLDVLNQQTGDFTHYIRDNLNGLSNYKITAIMEDSSGYMWVGTFNGLNKIDVISNKITNYLPSLTNDNTISDPYINPKGLFQDPTGQIWVCTKNGLNSLDPATDKFRRYFQRDGLLSDNVAQVDMDGNGNLWVTTSIGLSKINFRQNSTKHYTSLDGLDVNTESLFKDSLGYFYIGGRHENFYWFHPDSISDNKVAPNVYITSLLLFNKPIGVFPFDKTSPISKSLEYTKELTLNYKQSDFAFEFTALNYILPEKNRFAYKLEGFNEDWIYTNSKRRIAGYTNLRHGTYVFRVKASNNDGIWNEQGTEIRINILPPPWKTNFAFFIYALIIAVSLYIVRKIIVHQMNLKNSLKIEHLERDKEREFHKIKTKFFTNISHEFRTPLTLISGPINKLISSAEENNTPKDILKYYHLIERNVNRLAELTNQLLDFRKIETGTMKIEVAQGDIVQFIKSISERFMPLAESKEISVQLSLPLKPIDSWFDADKVDKVVSNLLSNALKFTPQKGKIQIRIEQNQQIGGNFLFSVTDSGIGIAPEHTNTIFDRFFQVDNSNKSKFQGTGIGLALAKDLVTLFHGNISVESTIGKGSTFIVDMPIDMRPYANKVESDSLHSLKSETKNAELLADDLTKFPLEHASNEDSGASADNKVDKKYTILIIEDNQDLRFYIKDILRNNYYMVEAEDGIVGLTKAFEIIPDIIISDVRMPGKSGIEVVQTLKSDSRTSHIPIILLTALNSLENRLKGLETGADDYITKPFNSEILLLKLNNIIRTQQQAKFFYLQRISHKANPDLQVPELQPKEVILSNLDELFLQKALEIIEQNISDPEFNVERFSAALGMEASTLYKKLMALINLPPGEFIRDIRMKRAAQLLKQNKVPISDIAYMVGFDSPNYFSKVFRKYYKISPTDYILQKKEYLDSLA